MWEFSKDSGINLSVKYECLGNFASCLANFLYKKGHIKWSYSNQDCSSFLEPIVFYHN